jgi:hypothetical protein
LPLFDIDEFRYYTYPLSSRSIYNTYAYNLWPSSPLLYYDFSQLFNGNSIYDTLGNGRHWPITNGFSTATISKASPVCSLLATTTPPVSSPLTCSSTATLSTTFSFTYSAKEYGTVSTSGSSHNILDMSSYSLGTSNTGFTHCQWIRISSTTLSSMSYGTPQYSIFGIGSNNACVREKKKYRTDSCSDRNN